MARSNITMTLEDVAKELRAVGIPTHLGRLADSIADGTYPFGRVVKVSPTGRRTFEIFRVDFQRWLDSIIPKEGVIL